VIEHRLGAFERISWLIEDWDTARAKLADTEARMVAVLDDLELTELACSIKGLSPVGAAAILAETGDLRRFTSSRAVVKHAGLAPRQRMSGTFAGRSHLSGAGRPHLRTAAWRAVWGGVKSNPSMPPATDTSPPERPTSSSPPRPRPCLPARSCANSTP
jgi:transposase